MKKRRGGGGRALLLTLSVSTRRSGSPYDAPHGDTTAHDKNPLREGGEGGAKRRVRFARAGNALRDRHGSWPPLP